MPRVQERLDLPNELVQVLFAFFERDFFAVFHGYLFINPAFPNLFYPEAAHTPLPEAAQPPPTLPVRPVRRM